MSRLRGLFLVLALIAGIVPAMSAVPASADSGEKTGLGIRLVDVPRAKIDDPRARQYIIDQLAPDASISRRIEVVNDTGAPAAVNVYVAAADVTKDGFVVSPGREGNDLSSWASATPESLNLATDAHSFATITVRVPHGAARGERYAVAWAEMTTSPKTPGGITQTTRVGVRLYLSIGPGGSAPEAFDIVSLTASRDAAGVPSVTAKIHNTGERALDLNGSLSLSGGPGGLSAGPVSTRGGQTLAIGGTGDVAVVLDARLPDGPWDAEMTVASGTLKHTAKATITFPAHAGTGAPVTPGSDWGLALAIAAALLILLAALLVWRRRSRRLAAASRRFVSVDAE